MSQTIWSVIAFIVVGLCIYCSRQYITMTVPLLVEIDDTAYNHAAPPSLLCWINPDIGLRGIDTILRHLPAGCDPLTPGIRTNTFVGHQFLVINPDNTVDNPPKIITITHKGEYVDIRNHQNYDSLRSFDVLVEWHRLLLSRQIIATSLAAALAVASFLFGRVKMDKDKTIAVSAKAKGANRTASFETMLPRNAIKCYAVVTMVVNHYGHIFVRDSPQLKPLFTTLADAGGSSHLFNWLVGYNLTDTQTSSNVHLLAAYLFLQLCLDLPFPITYETLLSIAIIRSLLRLKAMNIDAATGRCWAADAHIVYHALLCSLLVVLDPFIGSDGLRLINIHGVMYAFSGRLFALRNADLSKVLLWLGAAAVLNAYGLRYNFNTTYAGSNLRYVYAASFVGLTVVHALLVAVRCDKKSTWKVPRWVQNISHYSLEIYVVHFVVFYACYAVDVTELITLITNFYK